jgi:hypothetical protein
LKGPFLLPRLNADYIEVGHYIALVLSKGIDIHIYV